MTNIIKKLITIPSRNKNRQELYRYCQVEYGKNADAVFQELRAKFDV